MMNWQFNTGQKTQMRRRASGEAMRPDARDLSSAGPLACVLYASEAERDELLARLQRVGLGEFPQVLIEVESEPEWGSTFSMPFMQA